MFEVEKKFKLSEEESEALLKDAEFISEKTFTDVYYDTDEYALTKNDIWLRRRGDEYELKLPMHDPGSNKLTQQYQEIEGEQKIREIFAIAPINDFLADIKVLGYDAFCTCITTRKKFKKDEFTIDVDFVNYGDFSYELAEIELMVEQKDQMEKAAKEIDDFATKQGLRKDYVRGKVLEYLFNKKPEHFASLVEVGVVRE